MTRFKVIIHATAFKREKLKASKVSIYVMLNFKGGFFMAKSKYKMRTIRSSDREIYEIVKNNETIVFSSDNKDEIDFIVEENNPKQTEEEIMENIQQAQELKTLRIKEAVHLKYHYPSKAVDYLFMFFIVISTLGFINLLIALNALTNLFDLTSSFEYYVIAILSYALNILFLISLINSRKTERILLSRLDDVEKTLGIYQKELQELK
jgi:hypothetical protein